MEKEYYEKLLNNSVNLYTKGTLMQYGLREDQALEIVSNLTGIAPEKLQELRAERINNISESISKSNEVLSTMISR